MNTKTYSEMSSIIKVAGVIISDKKLLLTRKKGTDIFLSPGGKPEGNETLVQALSREISEETGLLIKEVHYLSSYSDIAYLEQVPITIHVYNVVSYSGSLHAGNEIDELCWIDSVSAKGVNIGSIFGQYVIPKLVELGLII